MSNFVQELDSAAAREDGIAVSRLLSIMQPDLKNVAQLTNEALVDRDVQSHFRDTLWGNVAVAFWRVSFQVMNKQDPVEAYAAQNSLLTAANRVAEKADNWILPALCTIAKELRQLSIMADGKNRSREKLEEATRTINRSFTICLNDRTLDIERSKKWGVYFFVSELFKVYFKLNKQPLAKSVIKVLHTMTKELPPLEQYPKAHAVTYLYYWGVLLFIDQDYQKANEKLTEALNKCHYKSSKNKELILLYLVPTRIITQHQLPSRDLFEQFPRIKVMYHGLVAAMTRGDFTAFDSLVNERRSVLVKKYLYSSAHHLRFLTSFALFRKVYKLGDKSTRLDVTKFCSALDYAGYFNDDYGDKANEQDRLDDAECIVSTLISHGQVKGYISHDRRVVVLSNNTPFPKIPVN